MASERDKLLKAYYEEDDGNKKRAISKRILALDNKVADESSEKALASLDVPLKTVKGALSGDENIWYEQPPWMNDGVWAASQVAGDILLDPLNAVGGGMAKGAKTIPGAIASISNYIPNWYGPSKALNPNSKLSEAAQAGLQKATGFGEWVADSVGSAGRHALDPISRAKYAEKNVTTPAQNRVRKFTEGDVPRGEEKAVSQIQYTSGHIPQQTKSVSPEANEGAAEVLNRSFTESYAPKTQDNISEALQRHPAQKYIGNKTKPTAKDFAEGEAVPLSKPDADKVANWVDLNSSGSSQFVVKAPSAKQTGGHFNDVVYKNPAKKAVQAGFVKHMDADGNVDMDTMWDYLQETQDKYNDELLKSGRQSRTRKGGRRGDSFSASSRDEDGNIWLRGGKIGSAITEGGVSWLTKLEKDGTTTTWMMDVHDFGEKLPGMSLAIPDTVVAVTPPMTSNIKNLTKNKRGLEATVRGPDGKPIKEGRKQVKKTHTAGAQYQQTPTTKGNKDTYPSLFEDYMSASPSSKGVAKEVRRMAGEGLLAERFYSNTDED